MNNVVVSPPEELMAGYIAEAMGNMPVRVERQFEWSWTRDFKWRSDFALHFPSGFVILIEVDGRRYHSGDEEFKRDRMKDRDAMWMGYRIFRYAASEVYQDKAEIVAELHDYTQGTGIALLLEQRERDGK